MQVNNYIYYNQSPRSCKNGSMSCDLRSTFLLNILLIRYSIGGESLCVAQNTYAVKWFQGKELNMVFGLQLSFSRVVRFFILKHSQVLDFPTIYHKVSYIQCTDF